MENYAKSAVLDLRGQRAPDGRIDARVVLADRSRGPDAPAPDAARQLRERGAAAALVDGYLATPHASGWLAQASDGQVPAAGGAPPASLAPDPARIAAALALGYVEADAVLVTLLQSGGSLPTLTFDDEAVPAPPPRGSSPPLGLYAIVDSSARLKAVLAAGVRTLQLRIKADACPPDALCREVADSAAACRVAGARLFVNDHWQLAQEFDAGGVHLGQEDLLALGPRGRAQLRASGLALGISTHSLWELARAAALAPAYVACGPVWPTLTKRMPWRAQGLDNLAWWCAHAPAPVVAIGGILTPPLAAEAASCGPDGVCVVRGLGDDPAATVPAFAAALERGRSGARAPVPELPHPSLTGARP